MKIKTFHALTMQDAMRAIKEELGPDAIILSSKEVREGGRLLRAFNRPVLEVMAASDQELSRPSPPINEPKAAAGLPQPDSVAPTSAAGKNFQQTLQSILTPTLGQPSPARPEQPVVRPPIMSHGQRDGRLRSLCTELGEVSRLLGNSLPEDSRPSERHLPPLFATLSRSFIQQGMRSSTAELVVNGVRQAGEKNGPYREDLVTQALRHEIARYISTSGPLLKGKKDRAIGVLLGPSGAGKTAAAAKLASYYRLEERKSVVLITFDAYREAGVEQLRRYAKVIGVPFATGLSARQVHEGLRRHAQTDLVLIDMPGAGLDEIASIKELHRLFQGGTTITTHLVLPASTREQDLRRLVDRAGELPQLRLLFTKLDETESFGTMFELAHQTGVPLSYWSAGRRVPEDLEVASPERLADCLMAHRYVGAQLPTGRAVRSHEPASVLM